MLHNANTPTFVLECEKVLISATNIVDDYCFGGHPRGNSSWSLIEERFWVFFGPLASDLVPAYGEVGAEAGK
jgi:hypothetical protein